MKWQNLHQMLIKHLKDSSKDMKLFYIFMIFCIVLLIAYINAPSKDQEYYELGMEAYKNKEWNNAELYFNKIKSKQDFTEINEKIKRIFVIQDSITLSERNVRLSNEFETAISLFSENKYERVISLLDSFPSDHERYEEANQLFVKAKNIYDNEVIKTEVGKLFVCKVCGIILEKQTKVVSMVRKNAEFQNPKRLPRGRCEDCLTKIQNEFEKFRYDRYHQYLEQINEINKSEIFRKTAKSTKNIVADIRFRTKNWSGIVDKIETPFKGSTKVSLAVVSSKNGINITYHENWLVGKIEKGTKVYNQLLDIKEGDNVLCDFVFLTDYDGDLSETSLKEKSAMKEPEYSVKFLNISKLNYNR